jgi:uncharacterized protein
VVRPPDGAPTVDPRGKMNGRGAYLCTMMSCWELARKRHALERALEVGRQAIDWDALLAARVHLQEGKDG